MKIFSFSIVIFFFLISNQVFSQNTPTESVPKRKLSLEPIPAKDVFVGRELNILLEAKNSGDLPLIYEFSWTRGGSIDPETGRFTWKPGVEDIGFHPIMFTVLQPATQEQSSQAAIITVKAPQYRPILSMASRTDLTEQLIELKEGENFALVIEGVDKNQNDKLKLSYFVDLIEDNTLENAHFQVNGRVATFSWTPTNKQAKKKNFTLTFRVEDDRRLASEKNLYFLVEDIEHPPVFKNPTRAYVFGEDKSSSFQVKASDQDEEEIVYGIQSGEIRSGDFSFDKTSGKFQWKPGFIYTQEKPLIIPSFFQLRMALLLYMIRFW